MYPIPSRHPSSIVESNGVLEIPASTHCEAGVIISGGERSSIVFGKKVTLYPNVVIRQSVGSILIGDDVSLGPGVVLYELRSGLTIGSSSMLAAGVKICGVQHGYSDIHTPMREQAIESMPVVIGDDVWIGMNVVIHPGVTIGSHSIVGSGSVVTRSIPASSIAYGVPCAVRKSRL